ncbi:hypothetical protein [Prescottella subtropica]|uniref:hypothetical protein n=1 Tax=Prescottella subtropica TaxID=2545757 RepID=UPI0010F69019|nr:hypothetical protein [Prescottella subtropica]
MAQIRTQTLLVLSDDEKAAFQKAGDPKAIVEATKPLVDALKLEAKSLAALSKGSPTQDDLDSAAESLDRLKSLLEVLPASDARDGAYAQLDDAQGIITELRGMLAA